MKANRIVIGSLTILLYGNVMAGTMGSVATPGWARVISISGGPAWTNSGDTQTFFLTPDIEKTYSADENSSTLFSGEVFYGWQRSLNAKIAGQIGLAVAATSNASITGQIWDDADPQFNNYLYAYKINHTHIAAKAKLLADVGSTFIPYISGSIGVGFNHSYDFTNTPLIFEAIPNANFSAHTQTAFSYTAGIGLQKPISQYWQAGAGYEFADWGRSHLGLAPGQTLGSGLTQAHVYTNALIVTLTYMG